MPSDRRILVVEDDTAIRRLLRGALQRAGHDVIEAANARDAMASVAIDKPDAVLLDLGLPDRDGMELVPLIKAAGAAVLVVSARIDTAEKVAALDLGADDYLVKPFDTEEVLARIRTALRHRISPDGGTTIVTLGPVTFDPQRRSVSRDGEVVHLTPKEYGVLAVLAGQAGRVITHRQLLLDVWGPAHERHVEYLRIVIRALRQKLEDDPSRPSRIINELGVGYRLAAD